MGTSLDVRRARFGAFVGRALTQARERGMTIRAIEAKTGVSKTTFYRWRDGDWTKDPRASEVKAFCSGLGIPLGPAWAALGWTEDQPVAPEPLDDPDLVALARRLRDPSVTDEEKFHIRETVRYLGSRGNESGGRGRRTG